MSASVLGRSLDLRRQSLRKILLALEKKHLVFRHAFPHDPRAVGYSLTDAGRDLFKRSRARVSDLELQLEAWLGLRDAESLAFFLDKSREALQLARRTRLSIDVQWEGPADPLGARDAVLLPRQIHCPEADG